MATMTDALRLTSGRIGPNGSEFTSRECAVNLEFVGDLCSPVTTPLIDGGPTDTYATNPVGLLGSLDLPVNCSRPDDDAFLTSAMDNSIDIGIAQALITAPATGPTGGVWIGHPDVIEVPRATSAPTAAEIARARSVWARQSVHDGPVSPTLYLSPSLVPSLVESGYLAADDGPVRTVDGDSVAWSPAFDWSGSPVCFWAAGLAARVSTVELVGAVDTRVNRQVTSANLVIEVTAPSPCGIVRVGPAPA